MKYKPAYEYWNGINRSKYIEEKEKIIKKVIILIEEGILREDQIDKALQSLKTKKK